MENSLNIIIDYKQRDRLSYFIRAIIIVAIAIQTVF